MTRYEHLEKEDLIRLLQRRDAERDYHRAGCRRHSSHVVMARLVCRRSQQILGGR